MSSQKHEVKKKEQSPADRLNAAWSRRLAEVNGMNQEKRDPSQKYGNYTELDPVSTEEELFRAFYAMKDNAKESLPPEMFKKVKYFISWKYEP